MVRGVFREQHRPPGLQLFLCLHTYKYTRFAVQGKQFLINNSLFSGQFV